MKVTMESNSAHRGFTLLELLVTSILTLVLLIVIFADTNRTRKGSSQRLCLKNLRQLQAALTQYVEDHHGNFPEHEGALVKGEWQTVRGWVTGNAKSSGTLDSLVGGSLYPYVQRPEPYHCPADKSVLTNSAQLRLRSYSLNLNLYVMPRKLSKIATPGRTFSFIDEEVGSINDGVFATHPREKPLWWDVPTDRHDQGATFSFVDGHAEYWKWRAPKPGFPEGGIPTSAEDAADLFRLQEAALNP